MLEQDKSDGDANLVDDSGKAGKVRDINEHDIFRMEKEETVMHA